MGTVKVRTPMNQRRWLISAVSFGVWTFISAATALSMYLYDRGIGRHAIFSKELILPLINYLIYACLTPMIYYVGLHYPVQRPNWGSRVGLYLIGGFGFAALHVVARAFAYPVRNYVTGEVALVRWSLLKNMFLYNVVDDILFVYVPTLTVVHAIWYYTELRDRERRTVQLEAQLTQARLELLKSQLQPHFLFNTMHSISALMHIDVQAADRMMTRLSDLLRMSFDNGARQVTTLEREVEFVNGYLEIEKLRFEDRLSIIFDIRPDALDAEVPHLLLQPLVENAVRHGVSRRAAAGEIQIAAWHDAANLYLRVRDNGPGFESSIAGESKTGIGLGATRERLATLYGGDQSLDIGTSATGGVEVCVRMPFRTVPHLVEAIKPEAAEIG